MILKQPDSQVHKIALLEHLIKTQSQVSLLAQQDLANLRSGIKGEQRAVYEFDVHFGQSENFVVLHDLRLWVDDFFFQIDHLLLNRYLDFFVFESKRFSEGIGINEQAEFVRFFKGKSYAIGSPIEQNEKHCILLKRWLQKQLKNEWPTRLGVPIPSSFYNAVIIHPESKIVRPKKEFEGSDRILKMDQLKGFIMKKMDQKSSLELLKVVGHDTLIACAQKIASFHRPLLEIDYVKKYGLESVTTADVCSSMPGAAAIAEKIQPSIEQPKPEAIEESPQKRLICARCAIKISFAVGKFCWSNPKKFKGSAFCIPCQEKM